MSRHPYLAGHTVMRQACLSCLPQANGRLAEVPIGLRDTRQ
jgi:hypothetical protein